MSTMRNITDVSFAKDMLTVSLANGEVIATPLEWYPRLLNATQKQRENWKIIGAGHGIHWPEVDEDLSVEGMLAGRPSVEYRI